MHSLTIVFGPSPMPWILLYRDQEKAESHSAFARTAMVNEGNIELTDDFGQRVGLRGKAIHGVMLEDMDQSKLAHIEQGLHRARTQAKAQELAAADPILKVAAMRQGPAMLQPGFGGPGNGAFRGQ